MMSLRTWIICILALLATCRGARDRARSHAVTRAQRSGNGPNRGRFTLRGGMQCTWAAKDASDGAQLSVKCESSQARVTAVECEYRAKPQSCPGYQANSRAYYKQVSRALKKLQGKLCADEHALVKAGMCKRAPRDAHFRLDRDTARFSAQSGEDPTHPPRPWTHSTSTTTTTTTTTITTTGPVAAAPSGTPAVCKGRADHHEVAQEYCNSAWASVCAFFFAMLQSDEC